VSIVIFGVVIMKHHEFKKAMVGFHGGPKLAGNHAGVLVMSHMTDGCDPAPQGGVKNARATKIRGACPLPEAEQMLRLLFKKCPTPWAHIWNVPVAGT